MNPGVVQASAAAARVAPAGSMRIEPLYPATRLLPATLLEAERVLEEARSEAARVLQEAELNAQQQRLAAQEQAAQVLEEAQRLGLDRGAAHFAQLLTQMRQELDALRGAVDLDARRLAVRYAKLILDVEFRVAPSRILDLVAPLLLRHEGQPGLVLRLPPLDAQRVRRELSTWCVNSGIRTELRVVEDPTAGRGSIVVSTSQGDYEAGVEEQLRPLLERLVDLSRKEESP